MFWDLQQKDFLEIIELKVKFLNTLYFNMIKSVGERVSEALGIEIEPKEEKILERVLMNIEHERIGPEYVIKDESVSKVRTYVPLLGYRERLVKTGTVEIINYQPQTDEEIKYAELLVEAGLLRHRPHAPHLYDLTEMGKVQIFDILVTRVHAKNPRRYLA